MLALRNTHQPLRSTVTLSQIRPSITRVLRLDCCSSHLLSSTRRGPTDLHALAQLTSGWMATQTSRTVVALANAYWTTTAAVSNEPPRPTSPDTIVPDDPTSSTSVQRAIIIEVYRRLNRAVRWSCCCESSLARSLPTSMMLIDSDSLFVGWRTGSNSILATI